jgi:hypothetical protein
MLRNVCLFVNNVIFVVFRFHRLSEIKDKNKMRPDSLCVPSSWKSINCLAAILFKCFGIRSNVLN